VEARLAELTRTRDQLAALAPAPRHGTGRLPGLLLDHRHLTPPQRPAALDLPAQRKV